MRDKKEIEARIRFGILGNFDLVLHHKDPTLKECNPERYYEWRDEDLVVMTRAEHRALHNRLRGPLTAETKQKISENHADVSGENNPMFGVGLFGEANGMFGKKGKDNPNSGKHWFNNGVKSTMAFECPEG